jgi:arylsulfatase A-like enzyme
MKTRNSEYKRSCHESSIRVPMAFTGPGFDGGGQLRELVSLVDLPPTLLDAANLPVPFHMQGHSLMPLLRRQSMSWPEDVFVQISEDQLGRAVRTHRWKYAVYAPDKSPIDDAASDHYVEEFLYDLEYDPYEQRNLIGYESHRDVAEKMRARLVRHMVEAGEAAPSIKPAPSIPSGQRRVDAEEVDE